MYRSKGVFILDMAMNEPYKKVVLVTGASSGIGKCCAELLARRGWRVYGASRHITQSLPDPVFIAVNLDVTNEDSVAQLIRKIAEDEGSLDAIVNCAGFSISGAIEDTGSNEARRQFDTNFFGAAMVCRNVLPVMRAQQSGTIVNVCSIAGFIPMPFQGYYSASKAALTAFTRALRLEVAPFGVRAVVVEPGDFRTEFTKRRQFAGAARDSVYGATFARALAVMEADEQNAAPPDSVADLVDHILHQAKPKASYLVGPWYQRFGVYIREWVPARVFDWVLCRIWKL